MHALKFALAQSAKAADCSSARHRIEFRRARLREPGGGAAMPRGEAFGVDRKRGFRNPQPRPPLARRYAGRTMGNILLLLFCFAAGIVLRRTGRRPDNASAALNGFIINLGLPALALSSLHKVTFDPTLVYSALMPWVLFLIGAGLLWSICCRSPFPNGSTTC
jgi:hypothetical protein